MRSTELGFIPIILRHLKDGGEAGPIEFIKPLRNLSRELAYRVGPGMVSHLLGRPNKVKVTHDSNATIEELIQKEVQVFKEENVNYKDETEMMEALAARCLLVYLVYKGIKDEFLPLEQEKEEFLIFQKLFKIASNKDLPSRISALFFGDQDHEDGWLNWRTDSENYAPSVQDGDVFETSATLSGLAFIFHVHYNTGNYEEAMKIIAEKDQGCNCAIASQILGAYYGYESIPEKWIKNSGNIIKISEIEKHLIETMPDKFNELITFDQKEIERRKKYVKELFNRYKRFWTINNLTYQEADDYLYGLFLLKNLNDGESNYYKSFLVRRLFGDFNRNFHVISLQNALTERLNLEFITTFAKNLIKDSETGRLISNTICYEHILLSAIQVNYNPASIYLNETEKYICLWKLKFKRLNKEYDALLSFFKQEDLVFRYKYNVTEELKGLINYLSNIENDTSEESEDFKCQAFCYLTNLKYDKNASLSEILGYSVATTRELIVDQKNNKIHASKTLSYSFVINLFLSRIKKQQNPLHYFDKEEVALINNEIERTKSPLNITIENQPGFLPGPKLALYMDNDDRRYLNNYKQENISEKEKEFNQKLEEELKPEIPDGPSLTITNTGPSSLSNEDIEKKHEYAELQIETYANYSESVSFGMSKSYQIHYLAALVLLKDMDDELSIKYKNDLTSDLIKITKNRYQANELLYVISWKKFFTEKFDFKFISKLLNSTVAHRLIIYDKVIGNYEQLINNKFCNDLHKEYYLDINTLYKTDFEKYIFFWISEFNGNDRNPSAYNDFFKTTFKYNETDATIALCKYLLYLENDKSPEAEIFKCKAFSYLQGIHWDQKATLAEILGCSEIISENESSKDGAFFYKSVINIFINRKITNRILLTEVELTKCGEISESREVWKKMNSLGYSKDIDLAFNVPLLENREKVQNEEFKLLEILKADHSYEGTLPEIDRLDSNLSSEEIAGNPKNININTKDTIPVMSKRGHFLGAITIARLEDLIRKARKDDSLGLEIIPNETTSKTITLNLISKDHDDCKLKISIPDKDSPPIEGLFLENHNRATLFNIPCEFRDQPRCLRGFDRYFNQNELEQFDENMVYEENDENSQGPDEENDNNSQATYESILAAMREVNKYLTERSKERDFSDYIKRIESWQKILEAMDDLLYPEQRDWRKNSRNKKPITTIADLRDLIIAEAEKFKGHDIAKKLGFTNDEKSRFYTRLITLSKALGSSKGVEDLQIINANIFAYQEIYLEKEKCMSAIWDNENSYSTLYSFFRNKDLDRDALVEKEKKLYKMHYYELDKLDRECFLDPEAESENDVVISNRFF